MNNVGPFAYCPGTKVACYTRESLEKRAVAHYHELHMSVLPPSDHATGMKHWCRLHSNAPEQLVAKFMVSVRL
jgi:hypothetical protein